MEDLLLGALLLIEMGMSAVVNAAIVPVVRLWPSARVALRRFWDVSWCGRVAECKKNIQLGRIITA